MSDSWEKALKRITELEAECDSYKESAESWSTRAAQEQLRAEQAEAQRDACHSARQMELRQSNAQLDAARAQVQRLREASRAVLTLFYDTGVYRHPYQQEILDKAEDALRDTEPHGGQ